MAYKTWFEPAKFLSRSEIPLCCVGWRFLAGSSSKRIASFSSAFWVSAAKFTINENNYEGTAGDVVGKAKGYSYGPAFKFEYVLLVPVKGKEMKITFDDWIFKQDDKVAINRATMTKFGFKVAELTVVFVKDQ